MAALRSRRLELGRLQQEVARLAGLTQTYLSRLEVGKLDPRLSTLEEIARALRLEIMLVPCELAPMVRKLSSQSPASEETPLFIKDEG